jgi:hypothetical protein
VGEEEVVNDEVGGVGREGSAGGTRCPSGLGWIGEKAMRSVDDEEEEEDVPARGAWRRVWSGGFAVRGGAGRGAGIPSTAAEAGGGGIRDEVGRKDEEDDDEEEKDALPGGVGRMSLLSMLLDDAVTALSSSGSAGRDKPDSKALMRSWRDDMGRRGTGREWLWQARDC